jgi:hypothetical protein
LLVVFFCATCAIGHPALRDGRLDGCRRGDQFGDPIVARSQIALNDERRAA